jgi:GNAT superfamily N-acetyltransferase
VSEVSVRLAAESDLTVIGAVAVATGQHDDEGGGNPAYVRHLIDHGRVVVAELGGNVTGFGAVRQIGSGPAAVSMLCDLFVDPAAHGRGCGRAMLATLWAGDQPRMTFSSLHANAMPLYAGFGLDAWWPLLYLRGQAARLPMLNEWAVEPAQPGAVSRHELAWTGADRLDDHRYWAAQPGGECLLVRRKAEVIAAGTVITGGPDRRIVHLAMSPAVDDRAAAAAVLLILAELSGPEHGLAHVCLPAAHPAVQALLAAGWQLGEFDVFMATDPGLLDPRRAVPSPALA